MQYHNVLAPLLQVRLSQARDLLFFASILEVQFVKSSCDLDALVVPLG
jgi:hypothetical protein